MLVKFNLLKNDSETKQKNYNNMARTRANVP